MKPFLNILRKELKELITPSTFIPVIIMAIVFASLGGIMGGITDDITAPKIGVYDEDNSDLSQQVIASLQSTSELIDLPETSNLDEMLEAVKNAGGTALIIIPKDFGSTILGDAQTPPAQSTLGVYYIMNDTGLMESIPSALVAAAISQASSDLSKYLISNLVDPTVTDVDVLQNPILLPNDKTVNTYFNGTVMEGISPDAVNSSLSSNSFIVPFIVMMIIVMAGSIVISSMGMEKENKTLETLLTMPTKRSQIVMGKLCAAAIVGLLMAVIYMIGMMMYMNSLMAGAQIDLAEYGLALGVVDYVLLGISLFLAILSALALCMVLGIFSKDYKTAQSLTMPVTFLALIPFFIVMFTSFNSLPLVGQIVLFAIPFSHPMMAINNLMLDNYSFVLAGIGYELVFAIAMVVVAVLLFKRDILITGRSKRTSKKAEFPEEERR